MNNHRSLARNKGVVGSFQGIAAAGTSVRYATNFLIAAGNHVGDTVTKPGTADAYDNIANP